MSVTARRRVVVGTAAILLMTPLVIFLSTVGAPWQYFDGSFPPGQSAYIMMRPAGHLAFVLLFMQVVVGSNARLLSRALQFPRLVMLHRQMGVAALILMLAHPLLFAWARSLRGGHSYVIATLTPHPFENYWELMCSFGVLTLYLATVAAVAGMLGARRLGRWWRLLHLCSYPAFFTAFTHAISIGAETRFWPVWIQYWVMCLAAGAIVLWRIGRAIPPQWGRHDAGRELIPTSG